MSENNQGVKRGFWDKITDYLSKTYDPKPEVLTELKDKGACAYLVLLFILDVVNRVTFYLTVQSIIAKVVV